MIIEDLIKKPIYIEGGDTAVRGIYWINNFQEKRCSCFIMTAWDYYLKKTNNQIRYIVNEINIDNSKINEFIRRDNFLGEKEILTNIFLVLNEEIQKLKTKREYIHRDSQGDIKSNEDVPKYLKEILKMDISLLDASRRYFYEAYIGGTFRKDISKNKSSLITVKQYNEHWAYKTVVKP